MAKSRATAAKILHAVLYEKQSLSKCFESERFHQLNPKQQPFVKEICFGSLRWYQRLRAYANSVLQKPLKKKEAVVDCLLLVGLYQLLYMKVPAHAAISETVAATKPLKKTWAKGLLNACLRQVQRDIEGDTQVSLKQDYQQYSHPEWMVNKLKKDYPDLWPNILQANNQKPPFAIRINSNYCSVESFANKLGGEWSSIPYTESGLIMEQALKVTELPGFDEGSCSVQDGAAQLAAPLLNPQVGERILDACAAPGGKTCHLLEYQPGIEELIAVELDAVRAQRIQQNLDRLKLEATIKVADCGDLDTWWDGKGFDKILLDAPCSATGIIRRHPDIKWLRRESDIAPLNKIQLQLLQTVWKTLKPGGQLLYATCSILTDENESIIKQFLKDEPDVSVHAIAQTHKELTEYGWQLIPGENQMDGFYYCLLEKVFA